MYNIKNAIEKAKATRKNVPIVAPRRRGEFPKIPQAQNDWHFKPKNIQLDKAHLENERIIAYDANHNDGASYGMLRTKVFQQMLDHNWQSLAITSPRSGCGKSLTAINLAFSMARKAGQTIILIDLDLRKPGIASRLGITENKSLFDYLQGDAELQDISVCPDMEHLVIVANNTPVLNSSEVISSRKISDLISDLRSIYPSGIFIFDLPPILLADDAIAFLPLVDCALLLIASGQATVAEVEACERSLSATNLLGVVLNKSDTTQEVYY